MIQRANAGTLLLVTVIVACLLPLAAEEASLLRRAKGKDLKRENPMALDPDSAAAGKRLFERHCARCHGTQGKPSERGPSLDRREVREAAPGALFWVLKNGGGKMPSWSELPEPQRWQLISYLQAEP